MESPQIGFTSPSTPRHSGRSDFANQEFCPDASMDGHCNYCNGPETD